MLFFVHRSTTHKASVFCILQTCRRMRTRQSQFRQNRMRKTVGKMTPIREKAQCIIFPCVRTLVTAKYNFSLYTEVNFRVENIFTILLNIRKHKECCSKCHGEEYGLQKTIVTAERFRVYGVQKKSIARFSLYQKSFEMCCKSAMVIGLQNSYEESCQQQLILPADYSHFIAKRSLWPSR
jgi:hypothetical protein